MKSIYILLISTTLLFEIIMQVYSMPSDLRVVSARSPYAGYIKPDQVDYRDKPVATTLPIVRYSPQQINERNSNQSYQNTEKQKVNENIDEYPNKVESDIDNEIMKTRSQLKLRMEHAQQMMGMFVARSSDALQQNLQFESDKTKNDAIDRILSLRNQSKVSDSEIRSYLRQFRQQAYNQILQMRSDISTASHLGRETLENLDRGFPAYLQMLMRSEQQQKLIQIENVKNHFNSIVDELNTKIKQNKFQIFDPYEQKNKNILNQMNDILNEIKEKGETIETEVRNMLAEWKQNLQDAYSKAQTTDEASAKEYMNQEKENVTKEMEKIKEEMEQKMINEIKEVIDMLRTEVQSMIA